LALEEIPEAAQINFTWLSLGSEGREEQLLRTDQDNALIFEDSDHNSEVQKIMLKLAEKVNLSLKNCGFDDCPADIMARNPLYCQPLSKWKEYFTSWIYEPDPASLMNSTIFFDLRGVYGNDSLTESLQEHILDEIEKNKIFINHLAKNALQNPPPLSFFKNFLVEKSGEHKDEFDIKKRAMMPISDAARLLTLDRKLISAKNTIDRWMALADSEPNHKDLYLQAAQSYEWFLMTRTKNGLINKDTGRFIDLKSMTRLEKQIMRKAFDPIREIQEMIEVRFRLSYFS
jgi:CBS domain-containing protein